MSHQDPRLECLERWPPRFDWDECFSKAHLFSRPTASLTVSKAVPPGARDIWREDKKQILAAAENHGYRILFESKLVVSFLRG